MADIMVYIWLGVVVVSLVGEALSMDMTSIWFSVGGVCAIISWFCWSSGTGSIILQVLVFVGVSLICLCTLRRVCKNLLLRKDNEKTNVEALVGAKTKLLTDVLLDQKGTLQIGDVIWACVSEDGEEIAAGKVVEILKISGNKLVVSPIKESDTAHFPEAKEVEEVEEVEEPMEEVALKDQDEPIQVKKEKVKKEKGSTFKDPNLL